MYWSYGKIAHDSAPKKLPYQTPSAASTIGRFLKPFSGEKSASRKCLSISCAPSRKATKFSQPIERAIEVPIADQDEYRPPTQSQKPNMLFCSSMPNSFTALPLVESAAKCFAMAALSPPSSASSQDLAELALVIVSCVVKVLDAIRKSVVSASSAFVTSAMCVPSTFETKCTLRSRFEYGLSASVTITGPRSLPPMPRLTTSVMGLPVCPFHSPERTLLTNGSSLASTPFTSGITSTPSTKIGVLARFRSATCSTARSSVRLIFSPANIALAISFTCASSISLLSRVIVSSVTMFLE
mmetsp:Transcript_12914/g.42943  ORF Transcript_12914/g.42943 Transcript_12914/m.42943 type:complete len:298 (+) Transcript_12914:781-1674(+)